MLRPPASDAAAGRLYEQEFYGRHGTRDGGTHRGRFGKRFGHRGRDGLNLCLETLTVEQLKSLCRDKKLALGGMKRDLVARLAQRGSI